MELYRDPGVYRQGPGLFTLNLDRGNRLYGEDLVEEEGQEFRRWDPFRSKLSAYLLRGGRSWPLARVHRLLYLGASHGTTLSHLSDILPQARLFGVEKSPRTFGPLLALARRRENLYPLLADAHLPERYRAEVGEVELLYQDVAQRDQVEVLLENVRACAKPRADILLMLKTRSVTQTATPREVLRSVERALGEGGLELRESVDLAPFARGHFALVLGAPG